MNNKPINFDSYVINSILINNKFGINEVNGLESLKSIFYVKEEYAAIENLIRSGNMEAIKLFNDNQSQTGEYLDILVFTDQNQKRYIVTVYDSNALEQDPQIIEIYKL